MAVNELRRSESRLVSKAVREKNRRDFASEEIEDLKRQMIERAERAGVLTLRMTHPRTGQRLTLSTMRKGGAVDQSRLPDVLDLLDPNLADNLFPPVTRRSFDWKWIDAFLAREFPKGSNEALAQRRIVEAVQQDSSWKLDINAAKKVFCLECTDELTVPKNGIHLCADHRKWYRISSFLRDLGNDASEIADLRRFNDSRQKAYRSTWVRRPRFEEWEENNSREAVAQRRKAREAVVEGNNASAEDES